MRIKQIVTKIKNSIFNKWMLIFCVLLVAFIVFSNVIIVQSTKKEIYSTVNSTPKKKVALILGTSRYTIWGTTNLYFKYRIEAAAKLYHSGKISHIIVSGDNSDKTYNEPRQMWDALLKKGIPHSAITLDFAGFRTLDSVVRSKEVFGQTEIIIISQRFHVERALFIASKYNIDAIGFAAQDPPKKYSFKTRVREYFAKTKAVIDLYIINKKPKYLGKKEIINI
ncbi:MAG: protein SanA [Flavobacteriales bacterium]|nr:MAG: protein SanA [Flavobacteriales bacterium]